MGHFILHILGIDTQQSPWYDFWSGVGTQFRLSSLLLPYVFYRHHNCHDRRCLRIARHTVDGTPWCNRHHHEARSSYNREVPTQEK